LSCKFDFDENGQLLPYDVQGRNRDCVKEHFVDRYKHLGTRLSIWNKYERYTHDLKSLLSYPFKQWIAGSFVSQKTHPSDIDIINIVHHSDVNSKIDHLMDEHVIHEYSTDPYCIPVYEQGHPLHPITIALMEKKKKYHTYDDRSKQYRGIVEIEVPNE